VSGEPAVPVRPTVGRIVHYAQYSGGPCIAAIVTAAEPHMADRNAVSLTAFPPPAFSFPDLTMLVPEAGQADTHIGGSWHWPERTGQ
jgi:hypothetical protein